MDVLSYLMGKKASSGEGGGGTTGLDWSTLGFDTPPTCVQDIYDYSLEIKENWEPAASLANKYASNTTLKVFPSVDVSIATTTNQMFYFCSNLTDVAKLTFTSALTDVRSMFMFCSKLVYIDASEYDVSNVTKFQQMFSGCSALTELDLSNFNPTKSDLNCTDMFTGCTSLTKLNMSNFTFTNIISYGFSGMFGGNASSNVPDNCLIIVKDATQKEWFTTNFSRFTNVQTVAEYEAN